MARIAGVDLPRNKRIEIALTYIFGIGRTTSSKIISQVGLDPNLRTDKLTEGDLGKQEDGEDVVYRALRAASTANVEYFRKSWGRDFELEADALGVLLLAAAGWEWTAFKDFVALSA